MDVKNRKLFLHSCFPYVNSFPLLVKEDYKDLEDSCLFVINMPSDSSSDGCILKINEKNYFTKPGRNLIYSNMPIDSIQLKLYIDLSTGVISPILMQDTIQSKTYYVKEKYANSFELSFPKYINWDMYYYEPYHDTLQLKYTPTFRIKYSPTIQIGKCKLRKYKETEEDEDKD